MTNNFILDAFNFRYKALLKQEQEIVQGYEDGILLESYLNNFRLEIRFLESELQIKDKYIFRDIKDNKLVYLTDDEEYDYKNLPVLKIIEQKNLAELKSTKNLIISTKNLENDYIKDLITEPINKDYSWGKYGKFNIIICNRNGFVNGVFLIHEALEFEKNIRNDINIPKKLIKNWFANDITKILFKTASMEENIDINDLKFKKIGMQKCGEEMLQGTYIHPVLVNSLASWVSPAYALFINRIINTMNIDAKLKEERDKSQELLGIKNDIIEQMQRKYNEMDKRHEILIINQEVVLRKLDNTVNRLNNAVGFIDSKKNEIRPSTTENNIHYLYIYKIINRKTEEFITYTCYRVQPKNLSRELKKIDESFKPMEIYKKYSVNSIQAWNKFKNEYVENIKVSYNDFIFKKNYTEKQLKKDLDKIFSEYNEIIF